ncbi:MAG: phosphatase PAP2 family protein [Chloroflexota bacterium]
MGIAIGVYLVVALGAGIYLHLSLTPDRILLLLLIAALGTGRVRQFFRDWSIFLVVLLAWQFLSGMSGQLTRFKPHVTEMIVADKALFFGHVPVLWLQTQFYRPGHVAWYDVAATLLYLLHFVIPMLAAFVFWLWKRPVFLEFMVAFLVLAMAGFATYVLFPAAPPWWAANHGYLAHVYKVKDSGISIASSMSISGLFSWFWSHGGWDQFGAVPSEHAAFPFLCFLYARRAWPRAGWLLLAYCLPVWIAVIYLGEHYAVDVIVGLVYAILAYALVRVAVRRRLPVAGEAGSGRSARHLSDTLTA